jgi:hypothetical protein
LAYAFFFDPEVASGVAALVVVVIVIALDVDTL